MKKMIIYFGLLLSIILGSIFMISETFYEKNLNSKQNELSLYQETQVINSMGSLTNFGWTKYPDLLVFNKSLINPGSSQFFSKEFNKFRYKKWEALLFTSENFIFLFAPYDLSYLGGYIFHYGDLKDQKSKVVSILYKSFGDRIEINDQCREPNCVLFDYENKTTESKLIGPKLRLARLIMLSHNSFKLNLNYNDNDETNITLDCELTRREDAESMVSMTPMSEDGSLFYYNIKRNSILVKGTLNFNNKNYDLSEFSVTYDAGRGVWPIKSGWLWANGNGKTTTNEKIGLNFGHGFNHPEASQSTEDCFIINDKIYKLPALVTEKPNKMSLNWKFTVSYLTHKDNLTRNSCHVEFKAIKRELISQNLIVGKIYFNIIYGQFTGICNDSSGNQYLFDKVYGIIEDKRSVW